MVNSILHDIHYRMSEMNSMFIPNEAKYKNALTFTLCFFPPPHYTTRKKMVEIAKIWDHNYKIWTVYSGTAINDCGGLSVIPTLLFHNTILVFLERINNLRACWSMLDFFWEDKTISYIPWLALVSHAFWMWVNNKLFTQSYLTNNLSLFFFIYLDGWTCHFSLHERVSMYSKFITSFFFHIIYPWRLVYKSFFID